MHEIETEYVNEVYTKIIAEPSIYKELSEYFTYKIPDHQFNPLVKARKWDGLIRLFKLRNKTLYSGLLKYLFVFARERGYKIKYNPDLVLMNDFSLVEAQEYIKSLDIYSNGKPVVARDYQEVALAKAIRYKRLMLISPTASGKSFIIYTFLRYLLDYKAGLGLIVVPTTSLVEQMYTDFMDYSSHNGWDAANVVQRMYDGHSLVIGRHAKVVVSTWQSIYKFPEIGFFDRFDFIVGDEAHTFKADCVGGIMESVTKAKYRLATTGTTSEEKINNLKVEGYFGPMTKTTTTKELMDKGHIAQLSIKSLVLKHPKGSRELIDIGNGEAATAFKGEMDYIVSCVPRNRFIRNLAVSIKGNTLLLFQYVDRHGKILYELIKEKLNGTARKCFFVSGETDVEIREEIRRITEGEKDAIIIASYGVFGTGVNIRNINNIIFASPTKSKIRTLQSIGRGLRLGDGDAGKYCTLYDIADDFRSEEDPSPNFTLKHYGKRMLMYHEEKFAVSHYKIDLAA